MVLKKVGETGGISDAELPLTIARAGNVLKDGRPPGAASSSFKSCHLECGFGGKEWRGLEDGSKFLSRSCPTAQTHARVGKTDHGETKMVISAGKPRYQGQTGCTPPLATNEVTHSTSFGQEVSSWCSSRGTCRPELLQSGSSAGGSLLPRLGQLLAELKKRCQGPQMSPWLLFSRMWMLLT